MKKSRLFAYLQLMRPANIVTALADILAGLAVAGAAGFLVARDNQSDLWLQSHNLLPAQQDIMLWIGLLLLATIGLYGGGVVFNDVFDAKLDAVERPERPIPSRRATLQGAAVLGSILLLIGIGAAFAVSLFSGIVAVLIAFFALLYDKVGKHKPWGPLNMGLCRGLNLLLGVSITVRLGRFPKYGLYPVPGMTGEDDLFINNSLGQTWPVVLIPVVYIAAITAVSRGEVHGGSRRSFYVPFGLYGTVVLALAGIAAFTGTPPWQSLPFLLFFVYLIFPPLLRAYRDPQPRHIGLAVKAGVIALIALDATLAAAFAGGLYGLVVLSLLPVSRGLAKVFAVT